MSELHWLITTRATADLILLEARVKSAADIHGWVPEILDDLASLPEAVALLQSTEPGHLHAGLQLIASRILDWDTFTFIISGLIEEMVMEQLTVVQVVETLRLLDQKLQSGALTMTGQVTEAFERDGFFLQTFPARLDAMREGRLRTSFAELQEEVDQSLSGYVRL